MPAYRNISTDELWVEHLQQAVKPDEVIDVPADDYREWPDTVWAPVAKKTPSKDKE